jgi:putative drug exporter of the RND superfamily
MSIFLYRLGGAVARRAGLVLGLWVLVLGGLVGGAALIGDHYDDTFTLPGSQSQEGQDLLQSRFGQTGTSGQVMFSVPSGTITGSAGATAVADVVKAVGKVPHVSMSNPLKAATPVISKDKRSTLGTVQFSSQVPSDSTLEAVQRAAVPRSSSGLQTSVGGSAYKTTADPSKLPELMGLAISFVILAITFGSLLAAGMPILAGGRGGDAQRGGAGGEPGHGVEQLADPRGDARPRGRAAGTQRGVARGRHPRAAGVGRRRRPRDGAGGAPTAAGAPPGGRSDRGWSG